MFSCFLSLFVKVEVSNAYVNVLSITVFFSINFNFLDMFLFLKKFCNTKYVLLALPTFHIAPKYCQEKECRIIWGTMGPKSSFQRDTTSY